MTLAAAEEFERRKIQLKVKFLATLRQRVLEISKHLSDYDQDHDPAKLHACQFHLHKTAGVAGSFGYADLGMKAADISRRLKNTDKLQGDLPLRRDLDDFQRTATNILKDT